MMDRETWLRHILEAIRDLADEGYQQRVWVRGEGPEVDSSTEVVCRLVDDYDLAIFLDEAAKNAWVSKDQILALQRLDVALARHASNGEERRRCKPGSRARDGKKSASVPRRRSKRSQRPRPAL